MLETIQKLFGRNAPREMKAAVISDNIFETDATVRVSHRISSAQIGYGYENLDKITLKDLRSKDKNIQLRVLSRISPEFSRAINIYKSFTNTGSTLQTKSDAAEQIIQDHLMELEDKGIIEETQINENVEDLLNFGFIAMQNIGDKQNRIIGIRNIAPEWIGFETIDSELHGLIEAVGYYKSSKTGVLSLQTQNNFVPLHSIEHKEPNFYYGAINTTSETVKGRPLFESAIHLAISSGEVDYLLTEWLRGQVSPNEINAVDATAWLPLVAAGLVKYESVMALVKDNVTKLDAATNKRDATQIITTDMPIQHTTTGTLQHRLGGLDSINEKYDVSFPRALHVPQSIFGVKRTGSTLNDTQTLHEVLAFYKNVLMFRRVISRGRTKLYKAKLIEAGNTDPLQHGFKDNDPEIKSILNEALLRECESAKILVEMGVFTIDEIREAFVSGTLDLTQFPPEHPDPEGMRQQIQQSQQNAEQNGSSADE